MSNIEAFVTTYQSLFPGTPTPPMPSKPEDLGLSVRMAIRKTTHGCGKQCLVDMERHFLLMSPCEWGG